MASDVVDTTTGPRAGTPMVRAEAVHKRFGHLEVLKGIDLEVWPGQVVVLLGASGSGKSTFLRCINHLEQINGGRLWVDGELVGSSNSISLGSMASARAIATRCCWPPDSWAG